MKEGPEHLDENNQSNWLELIKKAAHLERVSQEEKLSKIDKNDDSHLSLAQQRMWFLDSLQEKTSAYSIRTVTELTGDLDIHALQSSINDLFIRHDILKSYYPNVEDKPVKKICKEIDTTLELIDLTENNSDVSNSTLEKSVEDIVLLPMDIDKPPLVRFHLIKYKNNQYIFIILLHHIISDGWSLDIIYRDLSIGYNAYKIKQDPAYPHLSSTYSDYTRKEDQQYQLTDDYEKSLAYWKSQLQDYQVLNFPHDNQRPNIQSFTGDKIEIYFDDELIKKFELLLKEESLTLYVGLMTIFSFLLARYTGQSDILFGTPVANRHMIEYENTIGLFVNSIVMRFQFEKNPSFIEAARYVKDIFVDGISNQRVPFEKVVDVLHPQRTLSHNPIFQVMFALQNANPELFSFDGIEERDFEMRNQPARFDLESTFWRTSKGLRWRIVYSTDIIEKYRCHQMAEHFQIIMKEIVNYPCKKLWNICYLSEHEKNEIEFFSHGYNNYLFSTHETTVISLFENIVKKYPNKPAIKTSNGELSYDKLDKYSNYMAVYFGSMLNRVGNQISTYRIKSKSC